MRLLAEELGATAKGKLTFELISHRFTARAKKIIMERFPRTTLEKDETKRKLKWGRYGYGKYMYPPEQLEKLKSYMIREITTAFPEAEIEYFT